MSEMLRFEGNYECVLGTLFCGKNGREGGYVLDCIASGSSGRSIA